MKKEFVTLQEFKSNKNSNISHAKFLYDKIKAAANKTPLLLDGSNLFIGEEYFMIPNGCEEVLPVIIIGYDLKCKFWGYDDESGMTDTVMDVVVMDECGKRYKEREFVGLYETKEEAEEIREEMCEDIDE